MKKDDGGQKWILGFKTMVLGLCLYVAELLSLPVYGALHKLQTGGNGFYSNFWQYAGVQPYPLIFLLTGIITALGAALLLCALREKR